jgi:hypothetical protein
VARADLTAGDVYGMVACVTRRDSGAHQRRAARRTFSTIHSRAPPGTLHREPRGMLSGRLGPARLTDAAKIAAARGGFLVGTGCTGPKGIDANCRR